MKVEQFTVGPIVGYTTSATCRIFGRAKKTEDQEIYFGVARLSIRGEENYGDIRIFKINPIFDFSGITEFTDLEPSHNYRFQAGYVISESNLDSNNADLDMLDWSGASEGHFKTASDDKNSKMSFVFGSCRYMLKLDDFLFDDRGDKVFRSINNLIDNNIKSIDHFMMLGDQIYADDLNFIGADTSLKQFNERYRAAFSQPHITKLMSRVPTYMILDDHEIENDWPNSASSKDYQSKYPAALHAYQTYQVSHSPILEMKDGKSLGNPDRFWYNFESGCSEFFILDTRTERFLPESESEKLMISNNQLKALKNWLANESGKIKFIATSVPFFPDLTKGVEDKWGGFRVQRTEILDFIKDNKIRKVVFLSGDVHCSLSAQLICNEDSGFKVTSLVSSSFFWPIPFARSKSFQVIGNLNTIGSNKYQIVNTSEIINEDNFTHVEADIDKLEVNVYSRKGEKLVNDLIIHL